MHPALVRLPVAVALALPMVGAPALVLGATEATAAVHQDTADHVHEAAEVTPTPTPSSDDMTGMEPMPGMDHSGADDESTHEEGHESGTTPEDATGTGDETTGEHSEHADEGAAPTSRPRAAVLSLFAGVNGAVLITAGLLRRRDRNRPRHRPRPAAVSTLA